MFLYLFLPAGIILWAFVIEPRWLEIKTITLSSDPSCKIIHITDLHYKGDERLLQSVVGTINEIGLAI
jgi:predicted MPP superfamily phosphohydrolase